MVVAAKCRYHWEHILHPHTSASKRASQTEKETEKERGRGAGARRTEQQKIGPGEEAQGGHCMLDPREEPGFKIACHTSAHARNEMFAVDKGQHPNASCWAYRRSVVTRR